MAEHPPRRSPEEQARLDAALTELFEQRVVFNTVLGLKVETLSPVVMRFDMRPDLVGHYLYGRLHGGVYGRLHGGVISAVLDATAGLAVITAIGEHFAHETAPQVMHRFGRVGTIDLRVDYLRHHAPGRPRGFGHRAAGERRGHADRDGGGGLHRQLENGPWRLKKSSAAQGKPARHRASC